MQCISVTCGHNVQKLVRRKAKCYECLLALGLPATNTV